MPNRRIIPDLTLTGVDRLEFAVPDLINTNFQQSYTFRGVPIKKSKPLDADTQKLIDELTKEAREDEERKWIDLNFSRRSEEGFSPRRAQGGLNENDV
jgi:hypothetical protein